MKNLKCLPTVLCMVVLLVCCYVSAFGQTEDKNKFASVTAGGSSVRWDVAIPNSGLTLTISAPDGRTFSKEFRAGGSAEFAITDKQGERLPDGTYSYELRLAPVFAAGVKDTIKAARARDDEPEADRAGRKRPAPSAPIQSGSFSILNGQVIVAGGVEDSRRSKVTQQQKPVEPVSGNTITRLRNHRFSLGVVPDQVIADDLIVQGSVCAGLDCVNNENFGFDTVRLKENNDRIQFDDTSTAAGFATNNWQIRANSSASGGGSFLAFVDQGATGNSETGTIVLEVDAAAPANSVRVSSTGKVGFRTATPVLDLHVNTTDTPAFRFEQNNSGGFTAQTWDVAGNEANFFVRDVTGGSRLPFRIRPGAPTSSIDIAADGRVGVGTASPVKALDVARTGADTTSNHAVIKVRTTGTVAGFGPGLIADGSSMPSGRSWSVFTSGANDGVGAVGSFSIFDGTASQSRLAIDTSGNVGIATTTPDQKLSVNGDASKNGGGSWQTFSDERLKTIKGQFNSGLKAVMRLQPLRYEYRPDNALGLKSVGEHIGFGAQALQKIIPEAVSKSESGYLMVNNDPIIWTMLNAIKEQQKEIAQLRGQVRQLRAASHRRRR